MTENKSISKFPVVVYGNVSNYNDVLSQVRCRIFYKGLNRNGTYITDEFAEKLISTVSYVPVKGIFDATADDYTDHGRQRYEGRIYGIVPEDPHFAWEKHLDEDGVEREYACVDVLLFTGIYQDEALKIVDKSQSMELYADSIDGDWKIRNGQKCFEFTEGSFLGLQVLGEDVEPCFEGAAFYTLCDSIKKLVEKIDSFALPIQNNNIGGKTMDKEFKEIFKLSDSEKARGIWSLINSNENGDYYDIIDVYDDYAICYEYGSASFYRVYYTKDDSTDSLTIDGQEIVYMMDVTEKEKQTLDTLRSLNGGTYERAEEVFTMLDEAKEALTKSSEQNSEFSQKIEEQDSTIATLTEEKQNVLDELAEAKAAFELLTSQIEELDTKVKELSAERDSLAEFKHNVEVQEKLSIIDSYVEKLNTEVLETYRKSVEDYEKEELEKELAFALVKANPSIFNHESAGNAYVPKDEEKTGLEAVLSRYKK